MVSGIFFGAGGSTPPPPPSNTNFSLSYQGQVRDKVQPGDLGFSGDGKVDGVFQLSLLAGSSSATVTSLELRVSSPNGVWNTQTSDSFWALGVASTLDSALLNPNGGINTNFSAGQSVMLFASNSGTTFFNPGQTYTATIRLSDGTTKTANVSIPTINPPPPLPSSATASFVKADTTTKGNWKGVYGAEGKVIVNDVTQLPAYAKLTPVNHQVYTWAGSTSDVRGLLKDSSLTDRLATTWYKSPTFDVKINLTDGQTHQVALYMLDWDTNQRSQTIQVLDQATGAVLDTRTISNFNQGVYYVYNIKGNVTIRFNQTGVWNSVVSGIFFGAGGNTPPSNYTLNVTKTGTGLGTVTSSPVGINCGLNCAFNFNSSTNVTLTATAASGSTFTGWSGACSGTQGTCSVTMDAAKTVTATFNLNVANTNSLTVLKIGNGSGTIMSFPEAINCGSLCKTNLIVDSTITLQAIPSSGSTFLGWTGACSGTASTCNVLMNVSKLVMAEFSTAATTTKYPLTVAKEGVGTGTITSSIGGINCGNSCSSEIAANTTVTLTATSSSISYFGGWSGACTGTGSCTLLMNSAKSVRAQFNNIPGFGGNITLTINKIGTGSGRIVSGSQGGIDCGSVCTANFNRQFVSLEAIPSADSEFLGWNNVCGANPLCGFDRSQTITAEFSLKTAQSEIPVLKVLSSSGPTAWTVTKPRFRPGAYFEVPPAVHFQGQRQVFITTAYTWQCSIPFEQNPLSVPVIFTVPNCMLVTKAPVFFNPPNAISGKDWARNYDGIFSVLQGNGRLIAINHGENKNECVWHDADGVNYPTSGFYPYQNTLTNAVRITSCSQPNIDAPGSQNCYDGGSPYQSCWHGYNGFINMSWVNSSNALSEFLSEGPIIWPESGYVDSFGARVSVGVRSPSAIIVGGFIYVFYLDSSPSSAGVKVARAPLLGHGMPGTFKVYNKFCGGTDKFCKDALPQGFDKSKIVSMRSTYGPNGTVIAPNGISRFSVAAVKGKNAFISVEEYNDSTNWYLQLRSSGDLVHWSNPIVLLTRPGTWDAGDVHYPMFMDKSGLSNTEIEIEDFYIVGTKIQSKPDGIEDQPWPVQIRVSASINAISNPSPNKDPIGSFDIAACDAVYGWSQDPDNISIPIRAGFTIDGQSNSLWESVAQEYRQDVCSALNQTNCNHGSAIQFDINKSPLINNGIHQMSYYGVDLSNARPVQIGKRSIQCSALGGENPERGVVQVLNNRVIVTTRGMDSKLYAAEADLNGNILTVGYLVDAVFNSASTAPQLLVSGTTLYLDVRSSNGSIYRWQYLSPGSWRSLGVVSSSFVSGPYFVNYNGKQYTLTGPGKGIWLGVSWVAP